MTDPILQRIVFQRFRSLPSEQVTFDNPTFVAGQNGSGKSNFADALAFLAEAMTSPLQAVLERRGGLSAVAHRSSARGRPSNLGLAVELKNPDENTAAARYGFELRARSGYCFQVVREKCTVWNQDGSRAWFRRSPRDYRGWKSSATSLKPALEPNALALPLVGGDARFKTIVRFLSGMWTYRIEPATLRAMQDPDGGVRLHSDGSNAASVLREIQRKSKNDWERIRELLDRVVPGTLGVRPKKHGNKLSLEFTQDWGKSEPVKFEAFSMSDGTLRVLGLLTAIFQRPAPSLLVIEEPEATMHPGALGSILDVLRHAARFMQVVVTTHSPEILDAKWIEDRHLRIVSWNKGATRINPVSDAARTALSEHLMGAGELLRSNTLTPDESPDTAYPSTSCLRGTIRRENPADRRRPRRCGRVPRAAASPP